MKLFEVYNAYDISPIKGKGAYVHDKKGNEILDFYGGHAVISVGHSHPHYLKRIQSQLEKLGFYSNAVNNELQEILANKLGQLSGLKDYQIFYSNSGAEAVENAIKIASLETGKHKIISFSNGFHGRTSAAASATDMAKAQFPIFSSMASTKLTLNDEAALIKAMEAGEHCAVIVEAIQGWGGIYEAEPSFLQLIQDLCKKHHAKFIADEVQAGYGRSGKFFSFQHSDVNPDIICCAKGMGNGFPIGATLFKSDIQPKKGTLGSTFGGNHLSMAAGIAVLEIIKNENLVQNAKAIGEYLKINLQNIPNVKSCRGKGLLIGLEFDFPVKPIIQNMLFKENVFCGSALHKNTLRLLPPLNISQLEADIFCNKLKKVVELHRQTISEKV